MQYGGVAKALEVTEVALGRITLRGVEDGMFVADYQTFSGDDSDWKCSSDPQETRLAAFEQAIEIAKQNNELD